MTDIFDSWANETVENRRLVSQEDLIVKTTEEIYAMLERQGISRAQLAERLEKSAAYVSQLLGGSRNMTLRTLADIAFALDGKVKIEIEASDEANGWHTLLSSPTIRAPRLTVIQGGLRNAA